MIAGMCNAVPLSMHSAISRTGMCSTSPRCLPPLDSRSKCTRSGSLAPSRISVVRTIAPDRSEAAAAAFWATQQQQDTTPRQQAADRGSAELEAVRRSLLSASKDTSVRRAPEKAAPTDVSVEDSYAASLGWRWRAHQLKPTQLWAKMHSEAIAMVRSEPGLSAIVHSAILSHASLAGAVANMLAAKLGSPAAMPVAALVPLFDEVFRREPDLVEGMAADLNAVYDRDPACAQYAHGLLNFKGVHALLAHRVAHWLWVHDRKALAHMLQSRASEAFHVDIHPGAQLGWGVLMDHATGIVIGETAVVGDNVSMLHHVTLGGSGTGRGIRHPTVGHGVLLGAGVSVLGPIMVGAGAKVGAGSVVVRDLPCHCVAVGVPARIVKYDINAEPVHEMDQCYDLIQDYVI